MTCNCEPGRNDNPGNPYIPYRMEIKDVIVENPERDLKTFVLNFLNSEEEKSFTYIPGQFAEVSAFGVGEAPFGIASSPTEKGIVSFTVKKVGQVTSSLHMLEKGDVIGLRGPLGNSWPIEKLINKNLVIVSGGFAFTTLRSLLYYVLDPDKRKLFKRVTVVYGARNPDQLLYKAQLREWSKRDDLELNLTIDKAVEGWNGIVGFVPAVTEQVVKNALNTVALVCGPPVMIKFTIPVLKKIGFTPDNIYTSLEMKMKCGIGMCGRCNIGSKFVCKDGPVFSLKELEELPAEY